MNPCYSLFFIIFLNFFEFQEFLLPLGVLDSKFLWGVREVWTCVGHVSLFAASKAKSLLEAFFSFFLGKLLEFYCINVYGIGIFGGSGGWGKGLEGLGRSSTLLGDLLRIVPLVLEMDCF